MKFTCSKVDVLFGNNHAREGFSQKERFLLKRDADSYDDFYVDLYDELHSPAKRAKEIIKIIELSQPSKEHCVFLDVGSGTGHLLKEMQEEGYKVYGIDKSDAMVRHCDKKFPSTKTREGDVLDPMAFEHFTFTHILCTYFTIYEINEKTKFFRNCYLWLKPGGYLYLHLIDPEKYNTMVPGGKPWFVKNVDTKVSSTQIDFIDFKYEGSYSMSEECSFIEKFTDYKTGNVRQNERSLFIEPIESILEKAKMCGFIVHGQADTRVQADTGEKVFILERGN
jgi:SAM-dependent methyltransferase